MFTTSKTMKGDITKTRRWSIYIALCEYAMAHAGLPSQRRCVIIFNRAAAAKGERPMKWPTFRGHIERLRKEGFIDFDMTLGTVSIAAAKLTVDIGARPPHNLATPQIH